MLEYTPNKAGIEFVEGLEKELDPRSLAMILASMLLEEEESETEEPDQIGFTEKKIRQLLKKEDDKFSKTHQGRGRTNRRHDNTDEKHKSRKSNDFHRKDHKDRKEKKDRKHGSYGDDFSNRDRKFKEDKKKKKN